MADNFHGVLIFIIFVVDLALTKFPSMTINAYGGDGHGQNHRGSAANYFQLLVATIKVSPSY